jgi:hypothetical protein
MRYQNIKMKILLSRGTNGMLPDLSPASSSSSDSITRSFCIIKMFSYIIKQRIVEFKFSRLFSEMNRRLWKLKKVFSLSESLRHTGSPCSFRYLFQARINILYASSRNMKDVKKYCQNFETSLSVTKYEDEKERKKMRPYYCLVLQFREHFER